MLLVQACCDGKIGIVKKIIQKGGNVNSKNDEGVSWLYMACRYGHDDIVRFLLQHKADVNLEIWNNLSPLHVASFYGHEKIVRMLLEVVGIEINKVTLDHNQSVLHAACKGDNPTIVKLLLEHGADPTIITNGGSFCLYEACMTGNTEIVRLLLEAGEKEQNTGNLHSPLHAMVFHRKNKDGNLDITGTPLTMACERGYIECVKLLVKAGCDPSLCTSDGNSPIFYATYHQHHRIISILIKAGANPNIVDKKGKSPIGIACKRGYTEVVKALLCGGANPDASFMGGCPRCNARKNNFSEIVNILQDFIRFYSIPSLCKS